MTALIQLQSKSEDLPLNYSSLSKQFTYTITTHLSLKRQLTNYTYNYHHIASQFITIVNELHLQIYYRATQITHFNTLTSKTCICFAQFTHFNNLLDWLYNPNEQLRNFFDIDDGVKMYVYCFRDISTKCKTLYLLAGSAWFSI